MPGSLRSPEDSNFVLIDCRGLHLLISQDTKVCYSIVTIIVLVKNISVELRGVFNIIYAFRDISLIELVVICHCIILRYSFPFTLFAPSFAPLLLY